MKRRPRIRERKLGRHRADGLYWAGGLIEIDPRQLSRDRLDTLLHEMLHHYCPHWSEEKVTETARQMTSVLWRQRYRRVER